MAERKEFKAATVTITNTNPVLDEDRGNVAFRYFRVNFVETLKPADVVVITTMTAEETAYYMALNDTVTGLKVTVATATE